MSGLKLVSQHPAFMTIEDAFDHPEISRSRTAGRLLKEDGYSLLGELCFASEAELYRIPNFSHASMAAVKKVLEFYHLPPVGSRYEISARSSVPFHNAHRARAFLNKNLPRPLEEGDAEFSKKQEKPVSARRVLDPLTRTTEAAVRAFARTPGITPEQLADYETLVRALTRSQLAAMAYRVK